MKDIRIIRIFCTRANFYKSIHTEVDSSINKLAHKGTGDATVILATPVCQRVRSNISFARLIALSNQIKLLLPDIDVAPDITFDQYRLNHLSIDIPTLRSFPLNFNWSRDPWIAPLPRSSPLIFYEAIFVHIRTRNFPFFFFFNKNIVIATSFKFLHNWWLKRDWNLNFYDLHLF